MRVFGATLEVSPFRGLESLTPLDILNAWVSANTSVGVPRLVRGLLLVRARRSARQKNCFTHRRQYDARKNTQSGHKQLFFMGHEPPMNHG